MPGFKSNNIANSSSEFNYENFRDINNRDFRPITSSIICDKQAGAYKCDENYNKNYWIPGKKYYKSSNPIPLNGSTNVLNSTDLIFLQGLNSNTHYVFFSDNYYNINSATNLNHDNVYYARLDNN